MQAMPRFPQRPSGSGLPVAWFLMDAPRPTFASDSGDVGDLMGNVPAGVRSGSLVYARGPTGFSLSAPGTTCSASLGTPAALNLTGAMSISCFLTPFIITTAPSTIAAASDSTPANVTWDLEFNRFSGCFSFAHGTASAYCIVQTAATSLTLNVRKHIAVVRSGAAGAWTFAFYLNGFRVASTLNLGSYTNNPSPSQPCALGSLGAFSGSPLNGSFDNLKIYNYAQSDQQVLMDASYPFRQITYKTPTLYSIPPSVSLYCNNRVFGGF